MRLIPLLLAAALLLPTVAAGQSELRFTPEQQAMIDSLPPAQRAEVMRQAEAFRSAQQAGSGTARAAASGGTGTQTASATGDSGSGGAESGRIAVGDTLVIEIAFPPLLDGVATDRLPDTRQHLLLGRHTVKLDRQGRLDMPGIDKVPLAGLSAAQAELRLRAEPLLSRMLVTVTRLPLASTGRDALEPFGYDIFEHHQYAADGDLMMLQPTRAMDTARASSVAVPADYRLGPGDTLHVYLYGKDSGQHMLQVTADGRVMIPTLGPVSVAGMTYQEARTLIEQRVREETIGTQASVTMGELRTIEVMVIGEVKRPGLHPITGTATVLSALYRAEGMSSVGSLRDIRVLRNGKVFGEFDLYELLLNGDASGDYRLESGDVVFVPVTGARVGVMGEVKRAAWFELDGKATVGELLAYAGGGGSEGNVRRVQIQRLDDNGLMHYVDVDATTDAGRATPVHANDVIVVPRTSSIVAEAVTLRGHVALDGPREWQQGLRVADLIGRPGALLPDADLDYGLVVRELDSGRGIAVETFSPRLALADPASAENLVLRPRDTVYAFGFDKPIERRALVEPLIERLRRQAVRDDGARIVQVTGAVRAPGFYPLADDMRITDLVRAGGGLDESAYTAEAEITRYDSAGPERRIAHLEVPLARALEGDADANLLLAGHDVLNVKQMPQWTERGTIELRGEIRFPGVYPIRPGETLSQVIERAGGLTDFAHPAAAVFTRANLREREQEQIENLIRRLESDIAAAAARGGEAAAQAQSVGGSMLSQLRETKAAGRLVIDLSAALAQPGEAESDVMVMDGDLLAIPPRPQEVTVLGEVNFPTSHVFERGASRDEYIRQSGGMTRQADKGAVYIVRANGAVEAAGGRRGAEIRPGDTIVVPLDADRLPAMVRLMNISQVVYQLAIAAAAWNSLGVL